MTSVNTCVDQSVIDSLVAHAIDKILITSRSEPRVIVRRTSAVGEFFTRNSHYRIIRSLDGVDLFAETALPGRPFELVGTYSDVVAIETQDGLQRLVGVVDGNPDAYVVTTALQSAR